MRHPFSLFRQPCSPLGLWLENHCLIYRLSLSLIPFLLHLLFPPFLRYVCVCVFPGADMKNCPSQELLYDFVSLPRRLSVCICWRMSFCVHNYCFPFAPSFSFHTHTLHTFLPVCLLLSQNKTLTRLFHHFSLIAISFPCDHVSRWFLCWIHMSNLLPNENAMDCCFFVKIWSLLPGKWMPDPSSSLILLSSRNSQQTHIYTQELERRIPSSKPSFRIPTWGSSKTDHWSLITFKRTMPPYTCVKYPME